MIVFEGIDGSGKTTISRLLHEYLNSNYNDIAVWFREPSDSVWGKKIREYADIYDSIPIKEEFFLFTEDRKWDVENNIKPALKNGKIVIMDRYYFSSACYQGAKGLDTNDIIGENTRFAPVPDAVFIIDTEIDTAIKRIKKNRSSEAVLFEKRDYLKKVRANYLKLKGENIVRIDGNRIVEDVFKDTLGRFNELFLQ